MRTLQSGQHTGRQQHTSSTTLSIHWITGNGHCCRMAQPPCSTVGRKHFPNSPQCSTGHDARAPGLGKIPQPFMEKRTLSPHKPSPPPDVIHPSQQKSHLQMQVLMNHLWVLQLPAWQARMQASQSRSPSGSTAWHSQRTQAGHKDTGLVVHKLQS